jgi:hypothetical protein
MAENPRTTISVQAYDPDRGAVADVEGGRVRVSVDSDGVLIAGDRAGLRDLARWCLAIADEAAPPGTHVHLDPNITPLDGASVSLTISAHVPD